MNILKSFGLAVLYLLTIPLLLLIGAWAFSTNAVVATVVTIIIVLAILTLSIYGELYK
jgi:hypothetical protein